MRKALAAVAVLATLGLTGCATEYYYEAEPIGPNTQNPENIDCFSIEVSDGGEDDEELGTFCRQGSSSQDRGDDD